MIIIIYLQSCNPKPDIKLYWLSSCGKNYEVLDSTNIEHIDSTKFTTGIQRLIYFSKDTITYYVKMGAANASKTSIDSIDSIRVRLAFDTIIIIGPEQFFVQRYIQNEDVMDGGTEYYWSSAVGVYATHSSTWPGLTILQTNDESMNGKIVKLVKATVPKFFIRDKFKDIIN